MTTVLLIVLLLSVAAIYTPKLVTEGSTQLKWFAGISFLVCATVLILQSVQVPLAGPTIWVFQLAKAIGLAQ